MALTPVDYSRQTDEELLETLLRSSERAQAILSQMPISELVEAHQRELGLTPKAYERLKACIELGRRIHESRMGYRDVTKISSTADAIEYCKRHFHRLIVDASQEEFHVLTLNTKHQVLRSHRVTVGTLDSSLVHPREVFRQAIKDAAASVLLAHNHPSGESTPSREDIVVTNRLTEAGKTIGIEVLDHIVLAKQGCTSIREYQ